MLGISIRDLCRERSWEWSAGVAIFWRRKPGRGSVLASLSFRVSRKEALAVWGRVARRRVVVVMPGERSFIVGEVSCGCFGGGGEVKVVDS